MKKKILILITIFSATTLLLSSCLKDKTHYVNFGNGGTFVDFPLGGFVNFSQDAVTATPAADANGSIVTTFAVNVASADLPTAPTTVTLGVGDASDVTKLNSLQSDVVYELMPSNAYSFTLTKVTIAAGKQYALDSLTFYKNVLDPSKSYVLPIKIVEGGGKKISDNLNIHYYHFIGNDFAGAYEHFYTRFNTPDSTKTPSTFHKDLGQSTFNPVSPTEFTVATNYFTQPNYDVTFTKTGSGTSATYSNFAISIPDVATAFTANGVTLASGPLFRSKLIAFDPTRQYTYAEALKLFRFYFTTGSRAIFDEFVKL
jgi:hypothetical protein